MAYASEPMAVAVTLARFSVLLFYTRIFTSRIHVFRITVYIMYAVNIAWGFPVALVYLLQCVPADHLWTVQRQGCTSHGIYMNYYQAVASIAIDVLILTIGTVSALSGWTLGAKRFTNLWISMDWIGLD